MDQAQVPPLSRRRGTQPSYEGATDSKPQGLAKKQSPAEPELQAGNQFENMGLGRVEPCSESGKGLDANPLRPFQSLGSASTRAAERQLWSMQIKLLVVLLAKAGQLEVTERLALDRPRPRRGLELRR